jgi:hypothetical protein
MDCFVILLGALEALSFEHLLGWLDQLRLTFKDNDIDKET